MTVYSKFHSFILPPFEKVYKYYEGLDTTDTDSSSDELESSPSYIRFRSQSRFFYYNWQ